MFDLEAEVLRWRERQERTSSLSAAELDELEDHLRARVNLEMELMVVPNRRRAFALARDGLGESTALSSEFAKAGTPRWRKLLIAGWAMFGASFLLPVRVLHLTDEAWFQFPDEALVQNGYRIFWSYASDLSLLVLPSLMLLVTIPTLWNAGHARSRWLRRLLGVTGMAFLALGVVHTLLFDAMPFLPGTFTSLGLGFWLWASSLLVAAIALQLRARHLGPLHPAMSSSELDEGALQ